MDKQVQQQAAERFATIMVERSSIAWRVNELEKDRGNGRQRAGARLEAAQLAAELAALGELLELYDYSGEGEPVADRAPAQVRSTKPLQNVREIAPELYAGRNDRGELQIIDRDYHRGYVTYWPTTAKPDGWRVHTWNGHGLRDRLELKRTFAGRLEAERALIREARKLASSPAIAA